ncbi:MAG: TetR/AcrR family transcriptional regulator [Limisphaerales bacterium]
MGRPDLSETRRAEILDAFERCVARHGLDSSSLELVAEEAGMKRSVVRHYVGNREDMIVALAEHVTTTWRNYLRESVDSLSQGKRVEQLLGFLLPTKSQTGTDALLVIEGLIAAGEQRPEVRRLMSDYIEDVVSMTAEQLALAYPLAKRTDCWSVAYGVVSIWFNNDSLAPLQLPPKYLKAARTTARRLIDTLATA